MAGNLADVVTKLPPPNGWQAWPTGIPASVKLNVSIRHLRMLVKTGNLPSYQCPDKTVRYDPEQLEKLARDLQTVSKRTIDDDDDDSEIDDLAEERSSRQVVNDSVNKTLVDALRNANQMVIDMHRLLTAGAKTQADTQDKVITRLLEREEARERTISEVYLAREALFNQQTERELAVRKAANVENRRAEMWTLTKQHLEQFVELGFAKFGIPREMMAKLEPMFALLQKLNPMQLQMLLGSGFLTKEQEVLIRKIVADVPPPEDVSAKVSAECNAILEKQAAEKKAAQAAQAAQAAKAAEAPQVAEAPQSIEASTEASTPKAIVAEIPKAGDPPERK